MLTFLILAATFIISALLAARIINTIVGPISKGIGNLITKAAERRDERKRAEMKEKSAERVAQHSAQDSKEEASASVSMEAGDIEENYERSEGVAREEIVLFGSVSEIAAAIRRDMAAGKLEGFVPTFDEFRRELPAKRLDLSAYILSGGTVISELKKRKDENLADGKVGMFLDTNMIYDVKLIEKQINSALYQRGLTFRSDRGIVANFRSEVLNPAFSTARSLYRGAWNGVFKPVYEKGIRPAIRTLWKSLRNAFAIRRPEAATVPTIREAENSSKEFVKTRRSTFDFARVMDYAQSSANVADDRFTAKSMSKDVSQTQKVRQKNQKDRGRKGPKQG